MMMGMKLFSFKEYLKDGGKMKYILVIIYCKSFIIFLMLLKFFLLKLLWFVVKIDCMRYRL